MKFAGIKDQREIVCKTIPDCGLVMALSYTGIPSPMLLKAFRVIT